MDKIWLVSDQEEQHGPYSYEKMLQLVADGKILPHSHVRKLGQRRRWHRPTYYRELRDCFSTEDSSSRWQGLLNKKNVLSGILFFFILASLSFLKAYLSRPTHGYIPKENFTEESYQKLLAGFDKGSALAFDKDMKYLWLTTNQMENGELQLFFHSIDGRITSNNKLTFSTVSKINNFVGKFKNFKLNTGNKIPLGEYTVDFSHEGMFAQKVLFGVKDATELEKQLQKFEQQQKEMINHQWKNLVEKYQTFKLILNSISNLFLSQLKKIVRGKQIEKFLQLYSNRWGLLLKDMTFSKDELEFEDKDRAILLQEEKEVRELGIKIGSLIAQHVEQVREWKKINWEKRKKVRQSWLQKSQKLENKITSKIEQLTQSRI